MMLRLAVEMKLFDAVAKTNGDVIRVDQVATATGADHSLTSETRHRSSFCCD